MNSEAERKNIGQKFTLKYSELYPLYTFTSKDSSSLLAKKYLDKIGNYKTQIEYQGNGLYRDLTTDRLVIDNNERIDIDGIQYMMAFENNLDKSSPKVKLTDKEKEIIKYYYSLSELLQIEELQKHPLFQKDKDKITEYREKIDEERIGQHYAIKYRNIKYTLNQTLKKQPEFKSLLYQKSKPNYFDNHLTIIEYIGKGIYIDLSTGLLITEKSIEPSFFMEKDRIDYSRIHGEKYVIHFPVRIDLKDIKPLDEKSLYEIGKHTVANTAKIKESIIKTIRDIQIENIEIMERIKENEYIRQQEEAEKEYEKHKIITKVKKHYNIK